MSSSVTVIEEPTTRDETELIMSGVTSERLRSLSMRSLTRVPTILWALLNEAPYFLTSILASSVDVVKFNSSLGIASETLSVGIKLLSIDSELDKESIDSQSLGVISWKSMLYPEGNDFRAVSYTHLTLPTNREV